MSKVLRVRVNKDNKEAMLIYPDGKIKWVRMMQLIMIVVPWILTGGKIEVPDDD